MQYNSKSISNNLEYSSVIYKNSNGYSYTEAITGTQSSTPVATPPQGYTAEADIHSHGKYNGNDKINTFSGDDLKVAVKNNRCVYLATPDGRLWMYNPITGEVKVVLYTLPSDPNSPKPPQPPTQPTQPE